MYPKQCWVHTRPFRTFHKETVKCWDDIKQSYLYRFFIIQIVLLVAGTSTQLRSYSISPVILESNDRLPIPQFLLVGLYGFVWFKEVGFDQILIKKKGESLSQNLYFPSYYLKYKLLSTFLRYWAISVAYKYLFF